MRQLEAHVTNTMGWSATTGKVEPWVYQRISETFVLDEEMRNRLADLILLQVLEWQIGFWRQTSVPTGAQMPKQSKHYKMRRVARR